MTHAILSTPELAASGASRSEIRAAIRGLTRVAPGVYLDPAGGTREDLHRLQAAAVLGRVSGVVASHVTAAVRHDLPVLRSDLATVHLSVLVGRPGGAKSGAGHHVHCAPVGPDEVCSAAGLPATGVARTVVDCARRFGIDRGVIAADAALHRRLTTREELAGAVLVASQRKGARLARRAQELASPLAESPGESLLRLRLVRMGLHPDEQVELPGVAGAPRVDFLVEECLVIEFDGEGKYHLDGDPARALWQEKLRQDRITEAGYEVLRITWADLWDQDILERRARRALARARMRRQPTP